MKAVISRSYGAPEVLALGEVDQPTLKANEVLVRVRATSVTSGDVRLRGFKGAGVFWLPLRLMFGILRPRNQIPGMEFAGQVETVGADVTSFRADDNVFGMTIGGANAEYVAVREDSAIAVRPAGLIDEEAAAIPFGAMSALAFLRDIVRLKPGEKILIHGASGAVGVAAVQLAKHFGAEVTGVCSTANLNLVRWLGADYVVDYTTTDFTEGAGAYDVILDTVGGTSFARGRRVLAPNGRHVFVNFKLPQLLQMFWTSLRRGKRVICGFSSGSSPSDLKLIKELVKRACSGRSSTGSTAWVRSSRHTGMSIAAASGGASSSRSDPAKLRSSGRRRKGNPCRRSPPCGRSSARSTPTTS